MLPHAAITAFLLRLLWLLLWPWYHGPLNLVMLLLVLLLVLLRVLLLLLVLLLMLLLLMRSTCLAANHSIMLGHHGGWRGQLLR